MHGLENLKIIARNFKCLGNDESGYERILPINLIIGRNNSGKSTFLEIVEYAKGDKNFQHLGHKDTQPSIIIHGTNVLNERIVQQVFRPGVSAGVIGGNHWEFGKSLVGRKLLWKQELPVPNGIRYVSIDPPLNRSDIDEHLVQLVRHIQNPLVSMTFKRLFPDRDIVPENEIFPPLVSANGQGATNTIRQFLMRAALPSSLVENLILTELNKIVRPDTSITEIIVQQLEDGKWEIYLGEHTKGRIPLSQSGSGLKTIILILVLLYLVPRIENKQLHQYIFGFEELENNLHPALQRRLLLYLRNIALKSNCVFFLTTHSNVIIDLFSKDEYAQILHVKHDGEKASVAKAVTYIHHRGILDDLDVRASDLLQSNGIVWVEGPSDRIYFNRWIDIWTDRKLQEGTHYQCIFYGGRLLAHLSADDPDIDPNNLVKILRVNRNAILLIDSDRNKESNDINETKKRLISEIENVAGLVWISSGKEVENYIPVEAIRKHYHDESIETIGAFESFADYLEKFKSGEGARFLRKKVQYAEEISIHFTKESLSQQLDLCDYIEKVCQKIRGWNSIST